MKLASYYLALGVLVLAAENLVVVDGQQNKRYDGKQTSLSKNLDFTPFVYLDRNGEPVSVGVELSGLDVLDPSTWVPLTGPDGLNSLVDLPPKASATPFQVLGVFPEPDGHRGEDLFSVSHFGVYFHTLSRRKLQASMPQQQDCIYPGPESPPSDNFYCAWAKGTEPLATNSETNMPRAGAPWGAECVDCAAQALYTAEPCVGRMPSRSTGYEQFEAAPYRGMRWVPSASEEYPDGPPGCEDSKDKINGWARTDPCLSHTPILGTFDGRLSFYQTMITSDYMAALKKGTKECYSFPGLKSTPVQTEDAPNAPVQSQDDSSDDDGDEDDTSSDDGEDSSDEDDTSSDDGEDSSSDDGEDNASSDDGDDSSSDDDEDDLQSGFYPSVYCVSRIDDDKFEISLESFTYETDAGECDDDDSSDDDSSDDDSSDDDGSDNGGSDSSDDDGDESSDSSDDDGNEDDSSDDLPNAPVQSDSSDDSSDSSDE
jgi:hypothetical protein